MPWELHVARARVPTLELKAPRRQWQQLPGAIPRPGTSNRRRVMKIQELIFKIYGVT